MGARQAVTIDDAVGFRDDNEALRQRVQKLEEELADTRAELEELRNPPKVRVEIAESEPARPDGGLAAKVAAKEDAARAAQDRREAEQQRLREKRRAQLEKHGSRLRVTRAGSETIVEVGPGLLRDQLIEQAGFGFFFAAINPGIFIVGGMVFALVLGLGLSAGSAFGVAIPLWLTVLAGLNLAFAHLRRPRFRIAFDDENFEVTRTGADAVSFLGRRKDLDVTIDDADREVRLRHRGQSTTIQSLLQEDLDALRELLTQPEGEREEDDFMSIVERMERQFAD